MKYVFPADYDQRSCYVVAINASLIPLIAGHLKHFEHRGTWATQEDYEHGYNAFAALQACLMKCCIDDLIESNARLYRLLDTALYGTLYTVESSDPLVVSPEIAPVHDLVVNDDRALLGRMQTLNLLLGNALNGETNDEYTRVPGIRDQLQEIITALQAEGNLDPEILAKLGEIAVLLG